MGGAGRDSARGKVGEGEGGTPTEGLRATGGGALGGFFGAWDGRCSEMVRSSATRFRWRSAWASGDTGRSSCSFLVPLEKMKLAIEAGDWGDRGSASGGPLGWALPGSLPAARLEALSRTAAWSPEEGAGAGLARPDSALRSGFWGADGPVAGLAATAGVPTERSRTICRSEGVTRGAPASSLGAALPLLQPTGSFRGTLARSPGPEPAGGGAGGAGGGSGEPSSWLWEETATEDEAARDLTGSGESEGPAGSGPAKEKKASSGGGKSAMDRSCSSGAGGGGGGQLGSWRGSSAVSGADGASTTSGFLVGGGGG